MGRPQATNVQDTVYSLGPPPVDLPTHADVVHLVLSIHF